MQKNPEWVCDYLKAKSPDALRLLMLANNMRRGAYHEYRVTHDGKDWFAWYETESSDLVKKQYEALNERLPKG